MYSPPLASSLKIANRNYKKADITGEISDDVAPLGKQSRKAAFAHKPQPSVAVSTTSRLEEEFRGVSRDSPESFGSVGARTEPDSLGARTAATSVAQRATTESFALSSVASSSSGASTTSSVLAGLDSQSPVEVTAAAPRTVASLQNHFGVFRSNNGAEMKPVRELVEAFYTPCDIDSGRVYRDYQNPNDHAECKYFFSQTCFL